MVKRIARIKNGTVTNVEAWGDDVVLTSDMVDVTDAPLGSPVGPGYTYDGSSFTSPAFIPKTDEEEEIDTIRDKRTALTATEQDKAIQHLLRGEK